MWNWKVWEQGIHPPERLIYLSEVEVKELIAKAKRGLKGETSPFKQSRFKEVEVRKVFEKKVIYVAKPQKYEATNIGHAFDSPYWSWVRMIGSCRDKEEEEMLGEKIKEAVAIIKG